MSITERLVGDAVVLDLTGGMTRNSGYGTLKKRVGELVLRGEHRRLLLNLSEVPYMDSSCVGELVSSYLTARNHGGTLMIVGARGRIRKLLAIAKLDTVFQVFDTEAEALRRFTS